MGYTTEFAGQIRIEPAMSAEMIAALNEWHDLRHEPSPLGKSYGYYCQWLPTADGTAIEWDQGEKFYEATEWMQYLIDVFLAPAGHVANGVIDARGERSDDVWQLRVQDNSAVKVEGRLAFVEPEPEKVEPVKVKAQVGRPVPELNAAEESERFLDRLDGDLGG